MFFKRRISIFIGVMVLCCLFPIFRSAYAEIADKVIVIVNDEVITQREFDRAFLPVKQDFEANIKENEWEPRFSQAKKNFLEQMINSKLAISLAKKENLGIDEKELAKRVERIKYYYKSQEDFIKALGERGTNLTEFEREMREQMMAQKLVDREVASKIVITPNEIKDLYEKNKEKLMSPRQVKARSIMIRKTKDIDDNALRTKIEDIVAELRGGRDFAELAIERSEGPFAEKGGDMGLVPQGQAMKEIDTVLFSLKKGELSSVVESPVGYHVFLVEGIEEPRILKMKDVNNFLREQLFKMKFEKELVKWLEEKRKNAYISHK